VAQEEIEIKGILKFFSSQPATSQRNAPPLPRQAMRSREELAPLAVQISANTDLMTRFRKTMGCGVDERAREMIDEVRSYACTIDPEVTCVEGARLVLLLMAIVENDRT
jgi:hypothetical protein